MQRSQKEQMFHVKKTVTRTDTNLKIHKCLLDFVSDHEFPKMSLAGNYMFFEFLLCQNTRN